MVKKKEELKKRSKLNFVRVMLPGGNGHKYENAARLLDKWVSEGTMAGETMPQKSTYFYPKVFSGLVIYKMEDGLCGGQAVYSRSN